MLKTRLAAILSQKMDRKDFLKYTALGTVAFFGFGSVLKVFENQESKSQQTVAGGGYGSSAYGGADDGKA